MQLAIRHYGKINENMEYVITQLEIHSLTLLASTPQNGQTLKQFVGCCQRIV